MSTHHTTGRRETSRQEPRLPHYYILQSRVHTKLPLGDALKSFIGHFDFENPAKVSESSAQFMSLRIHTMIKTLK
jgi:hypothetical protein